MSINKIRVLGIDPGTSLVGYGIVDILGTNYKTVDFGVCRTAMGIKNKDRVADIYLFFDKLIKKYSPDQIAIESLFYFKNAKTVMQVSEIRGILLLVSAKNGVETREFTPLQIKQAVANYGRADKIQIQSMVKLILDIKELPRPDDISDALALAICCGNTTLY